MSFIPDQPHPINEKIRKLSPKPGDFILVSVESEAEADEFASAFQKMYEEKSLDHRINLLILPPGKTIELLSDEELDGYGLEQTEESED